MPAWSRWSRGLVPGFQVAGFWTAVGAALIVSLVSWGGLERDRLERQGRDVHRPPLKRAGRTAVRYASLLGSVTSATPSSTTIMPAT